jgi:hypothetical protein
VCGLQHTYYTWHNEDYQNFMVHFLSKLETIYIEKGTIIFDEMEQVNTVFFLQDASIDLGYDINKITKFASRL